MRSGALPGVAFSRCMRCLLADGASVVMGGPTLLVMAGPDPAVHAHAIGSAARSGILTLHEVFVADGASVVMGGPTLLVMAGPDPAIHAHAIGSEARSGILTLHEVFVADGASVVLGGPTLLVMAGPDPAIHAHAIGSEARGGSSRCIGSWLARGGVVPSQQGVARSNYTSPAARERCTAWVASRHAERFRPAEARHPVLARCDLPAVRPEPTNPYGLAGWLEGTGVFATAAGITSAQLRLPRRRLPLRPAPRRPRRSGPGQGGGRRSASPHRRSSCGLAGRALHWAWG